MKILLTISIVVVTFFAGCAQTGGNVEYQEVSSGIVCGQLSGGQKQTFPSMKELSQVSDAEYLHDGPCYEK